MSPSRREISRREVTIAGHTGDLDVVRDAIGSADATVRASALGALQRLGELTDQQLSAGLVDTDRRVRRRAAEIAAVHPSVDLMGVLHDDDQNVVETAAWAAGEHESNRPVVLARLLDLAARADEALVREAAVAALGAIGDPAAIDVIIAATTDKPAVRRRAVLALAPFEGDDVEEAIDRALQDRDWQVRQAAEDLRRAQR